MARGGKGGKGQKPTFTRVIPKFLQQYETMLTGPKPRCGIDNVNAEIPAGHASKLIRQRGRTGGKRGVSMGWEAGVKFPDRFRDIISGPECPSRPRDARKQKWTLQP